MGDNTFLIVAMFVIIAFFFFWTWRNNRKRQAAEAEKAAKLQPGVEVMTNFGLFGTVKSVDAENNKVVLEVSPGNLATVHRQTIARIEEPKPEEPTAAAADSATSTSAVDDANAAAQKQAADAGGAPEFGERITPTTKNDE
ncbi:preprotein translocase subunit YajC [Gryllotalpicola ginsengisoli]|uniref:preprotein translocase subunit YajC n=1 Tax=Gryllotalpicola ginsengisoli TaxID=444608 RepID=UPI0003B704D8|nr:preprotein translocase subunit YajC [Gryllotalpicola ginsengisoli]